MGSSKEFDSLATIFLSGGSDRVNEASSLDHLLQIEMVLVILVYSGLVQNCIKCCLLQGLVPIDHSPLFFLISK
jgi:hypothetical protein